MGNPKTDIKARNASIEISFKAPAANGGTITHYRIQFRKDYETKYDNEVTYKIDSIFHFKPQIQT